MIGSKTINMIVLILLLIHAKSTNNRVAIDKTEKHSFKKNYPYIFRVWLLSGVHDTRPYLSKEEYDFPLKGMMVPLGRSYSPGRKYGRPND